MQKPQELWVWSLNQEYALEEEMATHSSILAGIIHGQRSLVGCSPWGHKELDTTEWRTHANIIQTRILRWNHPKLGWGLNSMMSVLTSQTEKKNT